MPILWWFPTLSVPEPFLWPCFFWHELALLPSHYHRSLSIARYPTFLEYHPLVELGCPGAGRFLQDLILSPLHVIVLLTQGRVGYLPWPGATRLFPVLMQHAHF